MTSGVNIQELPPHDRPSGKSLPLFLASPQMSKTSRKKRKRRRHSVTENDSCLVGDIIESQHGTLDDRKNDTAAK